MLFIFKDYEQFSSLKTVHNMPVILRADGRYFSKYTKQLKLEKPFDERLRDIFINVSRDLMAEFNPRYIYTFSDEINILLEDVPFNGRIEKLDSVFASFIASSFMKHLMKSSDKFSVDIDTLKIPSFDCRIIMAYDNIKDYFKARQNEAWRNCLNSYAQAILNKNHSSKHTAEILYKLNKSEINDLIYENGINIAHVPTWHKRGVAVYKIQKESVGINPKTGQKNISMKNIIYTDTEVEKL